MALDRAHHRLFIPAYGNGGYRAFQLDEDGLPADRSAMYVIGRESIYGRRSNPVPSEYELNFPGAITVFDTSTQRLFGLDRFNNRILVFRADPDEVEKYAAANVVIGQKDFASTERGIGAHRTGMVASAALDEDNQRMFVADPPNNRVLVFDIHPDRLDSDPAASFVIGQADFDSRERGVGPSSFAGPSSVAYDPVNERLFVSDMGNHRVLVFDVEPDRLANNPSAVAVMGQPDFYTREPRTSLDQLKPESLAYDYVNQRLFIAEDLQHRVMAYDAHPDRVGGPATAIAVIGQPDAFSTHPAVSENRIAMPRLAVESETQKLYISEGFPAGNRISIFDITPGKLETGMVASDVVGHETPTGAPDFDERMAQGHLDGRTLAAARAVALDPVDNRLFVADEYNHRVVVWQLDAMNRVGDRSAKWVLGQPDLHASFMGDPSAVNMTVPLAVAYDTSTQRLYVGDGYHNRVLVYDAAPGVLGSGMAASYVLGQKDFSTVELGAGRDRLRFGVRMGRGIASNFIPMGLAVDEPGGRLFVSDGENNRVLVFDVGEGRISNGASAIAVLGQPDFDTTEPGRSAKHLHDPGHLAYDAASGHLYVVDAKNKRVLVFDASAGALANGVSAIAVLGQPDFESGPPPPGPRVMGASGGPARFDDARFLAPNGVALDAEHHLLYVTDAVVPADRVLVFDVTPGVLQNGASAVAILGASDAEPSARRFFGGAKSFPGQFTIRDARGIAVDPAYGRLFVTGSFASRVVVFHFPRASWPVEVAAGDLASFNTPDAIDIGAREEELSVRTATIPTAGSAIVSRSEMFIDERTKRHSRMLVSETAMPAGAALTSATYFVDGAEGREHRLYLLNTSSEAASVSLSLRRELGNVEASWDRTIGPGAQTAVTLETLTDAIPEGGTLVVSSGVPLSVAAMRATRNARDQELLAPMPAATASSRGAEAVIPWLTNGAGSRFELVLVNDTGDSRRGSIAIYGAGGARAPLGMDSELMPYAIPPHSARRFVSDGAGPSSRAGYAVVTADDGVVPAVSALVHRAAGDVAIGESLVSASMGERHQFGANLEPTLIRHGVIDTVVYATNAGSGVVQLRVTMGSESAFERMMAPGEQRAISIGELFGDSARGIVTVESDTPVSVTARQRTVNLRGEIIEVEMPPLGASGSFPFVPNGQGLSTELRLGNPASVAASGQIVLRLASGEPARKAILR